MRPGFGFRHPALEELLATRTMDAIERAVWANGRLPLEIAAYTQPADLPVEIVTSVRCFVHVGASIVVCRNAHDFVHAWPGGRRLPGESYAETAQREVHEETGWHIDTSSAQPIGWLHFRLLEPQADDYPYPHPDFLQVVVRSWATDDRPRAQWTDTEGYELESRVVPLTEARALVNEPLCRLFLDRFST